MPPQNLFPPLKPKSPTSIGPNRSCINAATFRSKYTESITFTAIKTNKAKPGITIANKSKMFVSIFIKDMITKWGSCSTKKDLTFSWRIIFFPNYVSNYIIAHEVAHLVEFNHSKKFWNNVKKIYGNFKSANSWMEKNSKKFYRYGISS